MIEILQGDSREVLAGLPAQSVHTCVTSPPYFGLRDYGTGQWEGGDPDCTHAPSGLSPDKKNRGAAAPNGKSSMRDAAILRGHCPCGAVRADHQIGLEETPDAYVQRLVEVFREVRRVLRDDGTLWLNLGDSYAGYHGNKNASYTDAPSNKGGYFENQRASTVGVAGLKQKDLIGIPWRVAFALQADGWYLRQDIIWSKPNPMPESVRDRCTKSHEYIFLLTKSPRYFFDHEAIKEPAVCAPARREHRIDEGSRKALRTDIESRHRAGIAGGQTLQAAPDGKRNRRSVWTVTTKPFKGAHFAVFPPDLIEPCILAGCPEGGTVLDPFFGAGTTGLVARQHGRRTVGIELNAEYIALARERLGLPEVSEMAYDEGVFA